MSSATCSAQHRQALGEAEDPVVLLPVAGRPPLVVVAVLAPALRVEPGRLDVPVRVRADPHVLPRRRDGQGPDAVDDVLVGDPLAVLVEVREALARPPAPHPRPVAIDLPHRHGAVLPRLVGRTSRRMGLLALSARRGSVQLPQSGQSGRPVLPDHIDHRRGRPSNEHGDPDTCGPSSRSRGWRLPGGRRPKVAASPAGRRRYRRWCRSDGLTASEATGAARQSKASARSRGSE